LNRIHTYFLILFLTCLSQSGVSPLQAQEVNEGPVTIGLLLPDHSHKAVIRAAELALKEANQSGGYQGREFRLVVRTAEGFWGAGSKESVSLVYEDRVRAIVGSLDGRNGHLAEQVATKSHLAYVETWATEPTLSQAFVPWFTRLVPNDTQQAEALASVIQKQGGGSTAMLYSPDDYDCRYAVKSLQKALAKKDISAMEIPAGPGSEATELARTIRDAGIQHLVLPYSSALTEQLAALLQSGNPAPHLYGTLHMLMDLEAQSLSLNNYEGAILVASPHAHILSGQLFMKAWYEEYGNKPTQRQVYVYDAFITVVEAIRKAGLLREDISQCLLESDFTGLASGPVSYDALGNRQNAVSLVKVENGYLVPHGNTP